MDFSSETLHLPLHLPVVDGLLERDAHHEPHPAYSAGAFEHIFLTLQNKNTSEHRCAGYLYTRRSKNASEKSKKKLVRGSLLSEEHRDRTKKCESV